MDSITRLLWNGNSYKSFNLPITRDVSVNRDDKDKLTEIVSSVLSLKFILFIFSLVLMIILTAVIPVLRANRMLFLFSMLACISEALFPLWFFQGVEKMKYITFINITTRVFATVFVFILIKKSSDFIRYPVIVGAGTVSGAVAGLLIVFRKYMISFRFQKVKTLVYYFRENTLYFISNVSTQIYINANKIIIGSFLGMAEVAWYDIADKIVNIAKVPLSLLGQALFPKVSREKNIIFLRKIMYYTVLFTLIIVITIFIFSGSGNGWLTAGFAVGCSSTGTWLWFRPMSSTVASLSRRRPSGARPSFKNICMNFT